MTSNDLNSPNETEQAEKIARFFNTFDVLRQEIKELFDVPREAFSKENLITLHQLNTFFIEEYIRKIRKEIDKEIIEAEQEFIAATGSLPVGSQTIALKNGGILFISKGEKVKPKKVKVKSTSFFLSNVKDAI